MYIVYILKSLNNNRHYVGSCLDVSVRLQNHNDGLVISTKAYRPWVVIYQEEYQTRGEARKREIQIKRYKSGDAFKKLVS
jgi:putative endonuclease